MLAAIRVDGRKRLRLSGGGGKASFLLDFLLEILGGLGLVEEEGGEDRKSKESRQKTEIDLGQMIFVGGGHELILQQRLRGRGGVGMIRIVFKSLRRC